MSVPAIRTRRPTGRTAAPGGTGDERTRFGSTRSVRRRAVVKLGTCGGLKCRAVERGYSKGESFQILISSPPEVDTSRYAPMLHTRDFKCQRLRSCRVHRQYLAW
jgi:hypothetical protein